MTDPFLYTGIGLWLAAVDADDLIKFLFLFFIVILPGLKGILSGKKKKDGKQPKAPRMPGRAPGQKPKGLDVWEQLLRGDIEPEPPPVPPPVPMPVATHEPTTRRAKQSRKATRSAQPLVRREDRVQSLPQPLPSAAAPKTGPLGGGLDTGMASVSENEMEARVQEVSAQAPLAAEGADLMAGDLARADLTGSEREGGAWGARAGRVSGLGGQVDWRQAIVLTEVLGRPLALRSEQAGTIPGLS